MITATPTLEDLIALRKDIMAAERALENFGKMQVSVDPEKAVRLEIDTLKAQRSFEEKRAAYLEKLHQYVSAEAAKEQAE